MIELVQFSWSPFCIVQRRILEYSGAPFKVLDIPSTDRSLVWQMTRQRYYAVPVIRDGTIVVFETSEASQVIAKYLNERLELDLFPRKWAGVQNVLWMHIESAIESLTFKLNDIYWDTFVPKAERLEFLRFKERKFGRGCLDQWRKEQPELLRLLEERLLIFEQMLITRPFLLDDQPRFVDFDLFGMLGNFLHTGQYQLPRLLTRIQEWYQRISTIEVSSSRL
jgi:glutathione S-transferase